MDNIHVRYGRVRALSGAHLQVGNNEIVGILGDNGAGKSTLVGVLSGTCQFEAGSLFYKNRQMVFGSPAAARANGIETVHQNLALDDDLTVEENFFLGREQLRRFGPVRTLDRAGMRIVAERILMTQEADLALSPGRKVGELSQGERQLLAILRALHFARDLVILDEPTAGLSDDETERVLRRIQQAKRRGISVIFVTHKSHEVYNVADRFVVLQNGRTLATVDRGNTGVQELEQLVVSSRIAAVREMAAAVAHQVRNPLGIMRVSVELLRDEFAPRSRTVEFQRIIRMVLDEIGTLEGMVTNFLTFSNEKIPAREATVVQDLVRQSIAMIPQNEFPGRAIDVRLASGLGQVMVDPVLLQQVLANLIVNALQASPAGGSVSVRAYENLGKLTLEVEDYADGIEPEFVERIFNPFFTTKPNGTGLGLSIVHRIVEAHDGSITVQSEKGKGTLVKVIL